jgi:hypothetical protein
MLFANETLIGTIAEPIRYSLTRIDTGSDLIIRVLRAIALTVRKVLSPSALVAVMRVHFSIRPASATAVESRSIGSGTIGLSKKYMIRASATKNIMILSIISAGG